jgi:hypothetical protein
MLAIIVLFYPPADGVSIAAVFGWMLKRMSDVV